MKFINITLVLLISMFLFLSCTKKDKADFIIKNATIYTVNETFEIVDCIAIKDGNFIAVGSQDAILAQYNSSEIIDAQESIIYPGFNDGHSHFLGYGLMKSMYANLVGTNSFDEVINNVVEHSIQSQSDWVLGRGWDQNDWENIDFPTNEKLNELFPDVPVVLTRIDGHALIANNEALRRAGIDEKTTVDGGEFVKVNGKLTGVLIDNAMDILRDSIPEFSIKEKSIALQNAQNDCFRVGLTSVTDAGLDKDEVLLIDQLQESGLLLINVYAMLSPTTENFEFFFPMGPVKKKNLTVSSVKLYIDGALGSRGALLLEPYSDAEYTHGLRLNVQAYYDSICGLAFESGYQVNTHAIGDSGNRIMLNTYAKYLKGKNDKRWRIEHAQIVSPDDLEYFNTYSIVPSVQATHCTSDMYWADERLGPERIKTAYAYNDLLEQAGWIVNGTDFPIEGINPLHTYFAAVARMDLKNIPEGGFQKENALNREDALRSITIWPAMGSFEENKKGSIEVGKVADFVIVDKDITKIPEVEIPDTKILATYVNGIKVFGEK